MEGVSGCPSSIPRTLPRSLLPSIRGSGSSPALIPFLPKKDDGNGMSFLIRRKETGRDRPRCSEENENASRQGGDREKGRLRDQMPIRWENTSPSLWKRVFSFARNEESITKEEALDGIYVIRTSEPALSPADVYGATRVLPGWSGPFRTLKGIDLLVRPIHHRTEDRVEGPHLPLHARLLRRVAYEGGAYAPPLWMMRSFFSHERREIRSSLRKHLLRQRKRKLPSSTTDGLPVQSLSTLLVNLGTRCKNQCRMVLDSLAPAFHPSYRSDTDPGEGLRPPWIVASNGKSI